MIIGEGEHAVLGLLSDLDKNRKIKTSYSRQLLSEQELNNLPFPARDLLNYQGGKIFNFGNEYQSNF